MLWKASSRSASVKSLTWSKRAMALRTWEAAEKRLNAVRNLFDDPCVATNAEALTAVLHEMEQAQAAADELYERWAELTEKAG
jgi:hypothetical protein